jgi:hypothetical protein
MTRIYAFDQDHGLLLAEMRKIIGSKAANIAAMAPGTHIRAAQPVQIGGQPIPGTEPPRPQTPAPATQPAAPVATSSPPPR